MEEAQKSLSSTFYAKTSGEMSKNLERLESIKAAVISSMVGTLASLPISLSQATNSTELILHSSVILISCALFGVTFRYAVRRDIDNVQLKTGTAGAFGFVKGTNYFFFTALFALHIILINNYNILVRQRVLAWIFETEKSVLIKFGFFLFSLTYSVLTRGYGNWKLNTVEKLLSYAGYSTYNFLLPY